MGSTKDIVMLSTESLARIDKEVAKYPPDQKRSAVMAALRIAQEEKGWLANETIELVADYLGMPAIAVSEVATFYNMYQLAPMGRHKITICTNISCALGGADVIVKHLQDKLAVSFNETTADGRFTLKEGECMGACGDAPLFLVNNKRMCSFLTPQKVDEILQELK